MNFSSNRMTTVLPRVLAAGADLKPTETNYNLMTVYPKQTLGEPQANRGQNGFALCCSRKEKRHPTECLRCLLCRPPE